MASRSVAGPASPSARATARGPAWWVRYLAVAGPGLIVAFADTEAGSVTVAATSGAQFGMKLVLLQLLLIVPLFVIQEMTVRLGTVSGRGHAALIRERYGLGWAWVSLGTMLITNLAALVTEFIGVAGAALIFGLPPALLIVAAATLLIGVALGGRYRRAELWALGLCLLELLFIPAAFAAHPSGAAIVRDGLFGAQPLGDRSYLLLVAGNIGAVIMPWMIFYQQSATVDKGLRVTDLRAARADTALGAIATQLIMIAIVVTTAATLYVHHQQVEDAAHAALALVPLTGSHWAGIAFGAGLLGAALIGALVVTLATAWAFGEAFRWPCSLDHTCVQAKRFYALYAAMVVVSAGIVLIPHLPLIKLTIEVEAFNAFVLPIVLGFLLVMANDRHILGDRVNSWLGNLIAIGVSAVCVALGAWVAVLTFTGQAGIERVRVRAAAALRLPLIALLAATVLAIVLTAQAGLSPCPDNDLHLVIAGRTFTICPVILALIGGCALLAAAALEGWRRDPQRAFARRCIARTLAALPVVRTSAVLVAASTLALGAMIAVDGDGLPDLPRCLLVAALLGGTSLLATLATVGAGRVALALGRRLVLAVVGALARAALPRRPSALRRERVLIGFPAAPLLAAGRGLRAPPAFVR